MIEIAGLRKYYPSGTGPIQVLTDLDLKIKEGEKVAILGHSGSGKTTLLALMSGLERPSVGEIKVLNHSIHSMSEKQLALFRARHMGIVFQQYHLMEHLTAYENVALPLEILGLEKGKEEKVLALLEEVGLFTTQNRRDKHFPHQLSGGECQRVALARALIHHPPLILADEPSGNLDKKTGEKVMDLLFSLVEKHQSTLILVTHNEELAHRCDRILHLDGGSFREVG